MTKNRQALVLSRTAGGVDKAKLLAGASPNRFWCKELKTVLHQTKIDVAAYVNDGTASKTATYLLHNLVRTHKLYRSAFDTTAMRL